MSISLSSRSVRPRKLVYLANEPPQLPLEELVQRLDVDAIAYVPARGPSSAPKAVLAKLLMESFDTVVLCPQQLEPEALEQVRGHLERTGADCIERQPGQGLEELLGQEPVSDEVPPPEESSQLPEAYFDPQLGPWQSLTKLAQKLGTSRYKLERAMERGELIHGMQLQQRRATDQDRARHGSHLLESLVRLRGRPPEDLFAQMQERQQQEAAQEPERQTAPTPPAGQLDEVEDEEPSGRQEETTQVTSQLNTAPVIEAPSKDTSRQQAFLSAAELVVLERSTQRIEQLASALFELYWHHLSHQQRGHHGEDDSNFIL